MIPYQLDPQAELELLQAIAFYDAESPTLSEAFVAEIEHAIRYVRTHPSAGAPLGTRLRRVLLNRFPYSVVYATSELLIVVVAIAHQRRRSGYWRNRADQKS